MGELTPSQAPHASAVKIEVPGGWQATDLGPVVTLPLPPGSISRFPARLPFSNQRRVRLPSSVPEKLYSIVNVMSPFGSGPLGEMLTYGAGGGEVQVPCAETANTAKRQ